MAEPTFSNAQLIAQRRQELENLQSGRGQNYGEHPNGNRGGGWAGSYSGNTGGAATGQTASGNMYSSLNPALIAQLVQAGQGDPRIMKYIQAKLTSGLNRPGTDPRDRTEAMYQAAAFNEPGADVRGRPGRPGGGGSSRSGMSQVKPQGESYQFRDRYQDNRQFNNRQRSMNQDVDQADRMNQIKLSLLQKLMGQGGYAGSNMFKTSTDSTREELFNNAGGPQAVPLKQHTVTQNSFSPQDILALFR